MEGLVVYTVGHSDHTIDEFVALLLRNRVETLVDVRSVPFSRPGKPFSPGTLERVLGECGVSYVYMGKHLGGRPVGDKYFDAQDHVLYSALSQSDFFQAGIERLLLLAAASRVCLMCGEEDPSDCHRHRLIGRVLANRGVRVFHIRDIGPLQSAEETPGFRSGGEYAGIYGESGAWRSAYPVKRGDKA